MGVEGVGGGAVIALAAALWLLYLMPTWIRRRQYIATERNAVRLQQTLRILAETAEVPEEIRVETTAKSVAEQHRALRIAAQKAEAVARAREAAAARTLSRKHESPREPRQKAAAVQALAAARLRRTRLLASLVLVGSVVVAGFGIGEAIVNMNWLPLIAGSLGVFAALGFLQRVATVKAARRATQAVDRTVAVAAPVQSFTDWQRSEPARPTWTPVPLPKPLYLSRRDADQISAAASAQRDLAAAAQRADEALRSAQRAPEVAPMPSREAAPAAAKASGYAAMGIVGETRPGITDLNDVLRKRRAV
ncbi:hypothetical protein ACFSBZ_08230 [Amnibacterium flavum]|uniref:Large exoprotein n=1 Tax=Amnibacterium flavum TaxID=2173173 RepID=A0A2V1HTJ2_9MICO|nr:hypothetical protein [Amnibacterium flavum]PVZ93414.1 hypothetical protein DDQ50_15695 [Amnibacterium flavum]